MNSNAKNLRLYNIFPTCPSEKLEFWKRIEFADVTLNDIEFLFVTTTIKNRKNNNKAGNYYFIAPLWSLSSSGEDYEYRFKAIFNFKPGNNKKYSIRFLIKDERIDPHSVDPALDYIHLQKQAGVEHYKRIPESAIMPDVIGDIKKQILNKINNMDNLLLDIKIGNTRTYFDTDIGRVYVGLSNKDYQFP